MCVVKLQQESAYGCWGYTVARSTGGSLVTMDVDVGFFAEGRKCGRSGGGSAYVEEERVGDSDTEIQPVCPTGM